MLAVSATVCLGMSDYKQNYQHPESNSVDVRIKSYKSESSGHWNNHHTNSSQDPGIAATEAVKPVSNMRLHPRASLKDARGTDKDVDKKAWLGSNHVHNHVMSKVGEGKSSDPGSTNGKRQRSRDSEEPTEVWTEHVSSSGRTYFYNKRCDKSQWERPDGPIKKAKCESTPSGQKVSSTPSGQKEQKVSSTPSGHKVSSTPSGHKVSSTPSGHKVSSTPSGHKVSSTPSGHKVSSTPSGHKVSSTPSGHKVSSTPSGHKVSSTPSGHKVSSTASGHKVSSTPSGHKVSSTPSGQKASSTPGQKVSSTPSGHKISTGHKAVEMSSGHKSAALVSAGKEHGHRGAGQSHKDGCGLNQDGSKDLSRHQRNRVKGHERSVERRHHQQRKSRSHSGSSSPPLGKYRDRSKQHRGSSGRSHVSSQTTGDKSHKTHTTASPMSTPKASGIQLISPTTPGTLLTPGTPVTLVTPATLVTPGASTVLSQTLSTIIDHTSILLERQQKLLAQETTPTSVLSAPNQAIMNSTVMIPGTPPTHLAQPLAKKRLSLTPQQVPSPTYSTNQALFVHQPMAEGVVYSPAQGGMVASPQPNVDSSGLHPLQRALLLQNQKIQQMPHPYQHGGVEPSLQTPPTAIPQHMTSHQSCPGSPILQSPIPLGAATPVYSVPMGQPLTPLQHNMFVMPAAMPPTFDPMVTYEASVLTAQQHVLSSKVLQRPVSKLAYLNSNPELLQFPNTRGLERVGGSQIRPNLVDRELVGLWLHHEALARQVEQVRLETHRRRTMDSFYLSGQLCKRQLALRVGEMKITSASQRVKHLQALVQELDKR